MRPVATSLAFLFLLLAPATTTSFTGHQQALSSQDDDEQHRRSRAPPLSPPQPPWLVYGTAWKKDATAEHAVAALRSGFRAFDTANQPRHYNELALGEAMAHALRDMKQHRDDLWVQSKFTHPSGHKSNKQGEPPPPALPYDELQPKATQVWESFRGSLQHLGVEYVDALILHAPSVGGAALGGADLDAWGAMQEIYFSGGARSLGVSNINRDQLEFLLNNPNTTVKPTLIQNRCYAKQKWDREIRELAAQHGIAYQGFSLLTVNRHVLRDASVRGLARARNITVEQLVLQFARQIGIRPLVGPKQVAHQEEDVSVLRRVERALAAGRTGGDAQAEGAQPVQKRSSGARTGHPTCARS